MTVNRTTLLDLPLPVTGTESGTWGNTTNNGLTQYLDIAIAGTLVLSTDADVTLTSTEGDSSATNIGATTAQYAILRWTATGSTTRNITALAQSKTYVVINATGGTQSIVLRGAGPTTGVTIISGEKAFCVWNGSDFVKVSSSAAAGGSNTQVQYNSSGVLAGSANFTFNGTTATINTLNLTNALGTTFGGTGLTSFTANGVLYASSASALTSGSALTFDGTTLATQTSAGGSFLLGSTAVGTSSTITATNNNGNAYANLNYVALSHTWKYGSTTFASVDQNGTYIWYPLGTEGMRLTSTGLGIGTSSPGQPLVVSKNQNGSTWAQVSNTTSGTGAAAGVLLTSDAGIQGTLELDSSGYTNFPNMLRLRQIGAYPIGFFTSDTERMRLDSSGNLGLGVTPSGWSAAYRTMEYGVSGGNYGVVWGSSNTDGGANAYGQIGIGNNNSTGGNYAGNGAASFYLQSGGRHSWFTAPSGTAGNAITFTQAMTLDASGNLLVGTTSGTNRLTVVGGSSVAGFLSSSSGATQQAIVTFNNDTNGGYWSVAGVGSASSVPSWANGSLVSEAVPYSTGNYIISAYTGNLIFQTNNRTERARITSGGDLLVGTTDAGATTGVGVKTVVSATIPAVFTVFNTAGGGNAYNFYNTNATNNGYRFYVKVDGGIANYQANDLNLSDIRKKTDIQPAGSYLDKICAIPVKTFLYKDQSDTERNLGVIAQDVDAVAPELVDRNGFGETPEGESPYLSIYQTDLQYALMKCIQEQQALITSLTARVSQLEGA